jgi:hypothetical protein
LLIFWIHKLHRRRLHSTSALVNARKSQIRQASSKVSSEVCESDIVSSPLGHPMHLPFFLVLSFSSKATVA